MTNVFEQLKANEYISQREFQKAISLFLAEKINEGYYLNEQNIKSSDYDRMYVLLNDEGERFGFGVKLEEVDFNYDSSTVLIQWGRLKDGGLFAFEDEESAIINSFILMCNYRKKVYFIEEKFQEIKEKKNLRFDYKYRYDNNHNIFIAKKLAIKGMKREKNIKIEKMVNLRKENIAYRIYKNGELYKEVNFKRNSK